MSAPRDPNLERIRMECLELAVRQGRGDPVKDAERFFAFVIGGAGEKDGAPTEEVIEHQPLGGGSARRLKGRSMPSPLSAPQAGA